jgi:hypothetical protein
MLILIRAPAHASALRRRFKNNVAARSAGGATDISPGSSARGFLFHTNQPRKGRQNAHNGAPLVSPLRDSFESIFKAPGLTSGAKFWRASGALYRPDSLAYRSSSITLPWTRRI